MKRRRAGRKRKRRATTPKTAIKLAERLMRVDGDEGLKALATQVRDRLKVPMADILDKVPGDTVKAKAENCGVSRQAYYAWLRGVSRPVGKQAERIEKLTGVKADKIRAAHRIEAVA